MNNDRNTKENDGGSIGSTLREMRTFLLLWLTQSFSGLGSAMTGYALVIWSYTQKGSALMTALLMVSSYAPYVLLSIFAGALSDRWNKKATMLICDTLAAATTVAMLSMASVPDQWDQWGHEHSPAAGFRGGGDKGAAEEILSEGGRPAVFLQFCEFHHDAHHRHGHSGPLGDGGCGGF